MVACPITQNYFKTLAVHWTGCVGSAQVHLLGRAEATNSTDFGSCCSEQPKAV